MCHVDRLCCEYLAEPLGVDTNEPRFSWQLVDPDAVRGRQQTAYQIVVERKVSGGMTLLWDSGRVESNQSVNVVYAGEALQSSWDCRWRVRVWDEHDSATDWSKDARFVMGLLDRSHWTGNWIASQVGEEHQHLWFRKTFELKSLPASALMYLCSVGYHELYVNGKRIDDAVLTPGAGEGRLLGARGWVVR